MAVDSCDFLMGAGVSNWGCYALCARSKSNRSWNSQFQPVSANERWLIKALKAVRGEQVQNTSRADVNARHEENRLGNFA